MGVTTVEPLPPTVVVVWVLVVVVSTVVGTGLAVLLHAAMASKESDNTASQLIGSFLKNSP